MQGYFDDDEFGRVIVTLRRGMRNVSFRWKNAQLHIGAPVGVSSDYIYRALDEKREAIRRLSHPDVTFEIGQIIRCFRTSITIGEEPKLKNSLAYGHRDDGTLYLNVPVGIDLGDEHVKKVISRALSELMAPMAARLIIPFAQEEAKRLGLSPKRFEIGRGMRKLGHCTPDGVIQFSRNLMFMPEDLVKCVVCHELAHLTYMDHSPAFHALLNSYLGGKRALLDRQINHFTWPIYR